MNRRRRRHVIAAALAVGAALLPAGCPPEVDPAPEIAPVFIVGTEGLEAPVVRGLERVFRPVGFRSVPGAEGGAVAEFHLVVAAGGGPLRMRLNDGHRGVVRSVPRSAAADAAPDESPAFWPAGAAEHGTRYGVRLPAGWMGGRTRLELYTATSGDGTPLGLATLEIAPDFYYMAVVGDSVQWGNGLHERDKISARVADTIELETGRRVVVQRYAHSGATILPGPNDGVCTVNCNGEVPTVRTSIYAQVGLIQAPEVVELVLLDGCINDVGLDLIFDPPIDPGMLKELTGFFCDDVMVLLLERVRERVPNAAIAVTGYYRIITEYSDLTSLRLWEEAVEGAPGPESDTELLAALIRNSQIFDATARVSLGSAVARVRLGDADARICFVDPAIPPERALFTPGRWLWSIVEDRVFAWRFDLGEHLVPEDPLRDLRAQRCVRPDVAVGPFACIFASVGHPNPAGAARYAERIIAELRSVGVLAE